MTDSKRRARCYPLAMERLGEGNAPDAGDAPTGGLAPLAPPNHSVPLVRRGVAVSPPPAPQEVPIEETAKRVFFGETPDGGQGFQVLIRDEVFEDLRCSIEVLDGGGVRATFFVQDTNLRRLLEAETGRLRAQLEARGLRVSELQVVTVKQSGE